MKSCCPRSHQHFFWIRRSDISYDSEDTANSRAMRCEVSCFFKNLLLKYGLRFLILSSHGWQGYLSPLANGWRIKMEFSSSSCWNTRPNTRKLREKYRSQNGRRIPEPRFCFFSQQTSVTSIRDALYIYLFKRKFSIWWKDQVFQGSLFSCQTIIQPVLGCADK